MAKEPQVLTLPEEGKPRALLLEEMRAMRAGDVRWREGNVFSLVFNAGDEVTALSQEAYALFFSENGLNPTAFPSLRRMEAEVVAMSASLLGGDGAVVGNMTSGGTESILLAVLGAREWARANRASITAPAMVLPATAHPAFSKAAHYFGLRAVYVPVRADFRADVTAMAEAIDETTALIVGSAPSYPQGVVDPVVDLAALAAERGILCHVDACVGGFMLPFVRQLGYPVPAFDFRVPGVTSISADLHKYGYAAKGASVLLYRNAALRRYQLFAHTDWAGGIYASPTLAGTRPGGAIAAAWAVMNHLGMDGYTEIARQVMVATDRIRAGIGSIAGVVVLGDPDMSVMALASTALNIYEVGDELARHGWHLDRQQFPPSLHLTVNRLHVDNVARLLDDVAAAADVVRRPSLRRWSGRALVRAARVATRLLPERTVGRLMSRVSAFLAGGDGSLPARSAPMYGMMGSLPNRGDLRELVLDLVEQFTALPAQGDGAER